MHLVAEHSTWTTQRGLITSKSKQLTRCSLCLFSSGMDELSFKIVKVYDARDEVIVRSSNFHRCILRLAACIFWTTSEV